MAPKRNKSSNSCSSRTAKVDAGKSVDESGANSAATIATTTTADASKTSGGPRHWLMKAEPDSRLEKGVDVAFSIDHFERAKDQTTSWDGVRNPEARSMMRDRMRIGDKVLFYHSNCKLPGVAGLATIVRQGYPDYTAWDPKHPYFDPKTDKESPKWYMVDVKLDRRLPNLVPLALLQHLAAAKAAEQDLEYLDKQDIEAISKMQLLNRGRLSVQVCLISLYQRVLSGQTLRAKHMGYLLQSVEQRAYEAILRLSDKGGWTDWCLSYAQFTSPQ